MANPSKRRGTEWETAVTRYLRERLPQVFSLHGKPAALADVDDVRRVAQTGRLDTGDIHAWPFVLEAKNTAKIDLAAFTDQAEREALNAGADYGVAVVKRRGKGPAAGYVAMTLETFVAVLGEIREARANILR